MSHHFLNRVINRVSIVASTVFANFADLITLSASFFCSSDHALSGLAKGPQQHGRVGHFPPAA
jgi:hypothetical protein